MQEYIELSLVKQVQVKIHFLRLLSASEKSLLVFLAPAVLAQPGALEMVSVSEWVSESVRSKFFLSKRPSL